MGVFLQSLSMGGSSFYSSHDLFLFFFPHLWWWPECDQETGTMQDNIYSKWEYYFFLASSVCQMIQAWQFTTSLSTAFHSVYPSEKDSCIFPNFCFTSLINLLSQCHCFIHPVIQNSCLVGSFRLAKSIRDITRSTTGSHLYHSGHLA